MVSIIIPVYNVEEYLCECLDSVQRQTYKDFEVICVNDGSSDNSAVICQQFVDKDSRFRLFNQVNCGVSSARNRALKEAKGEYVCFVDSDDVIEPHFLEHLTGLAIDGAFAICSYSRILSELTSDATKVTEYEAKDFIHHILNEDIEHPNICMMLFKNSIIQTKHLDFTLGCVRNEDTEFYIKYMVHEKNIVVSDYKGYFYRDNPNSAVHKFNQKSLTFIEADQRISEFLVDKGIVEKDNLIVPASVQYFIYQTARQNNKEIYCTLHDLFEVQSMMRQLLKHPRFLRKGVALVYLFLRKIFFFKILSSI